MTNIVGVKKIAVNFFSKKKIGNLTYQNIPFSLKNVIHIL